VLTTDYEIHGNYPSPVLYFSPLLDPIHPHARPPAMVGPGYAGGWSVGQAKDTREGKIGHSAAWRETGSTASAKHSGHSVGKTTHCCPY